MKWNQQGIEFRSVTGGNKYALTKQAPLSE